MFTDCERETKGFMTVHVLRINLVMPLPCCYVVLVEKVDCVETAECKQQTVAVALVLFSDEIFLVLFV